MSTPDDQPQGDEFAVDWSRWADGRAYRLKRKRDFGDIPTAAARRAAQDAAREMGKVVQAVRDRSSPKKFIWVQFADYEIPLGAPCPCGSRRLYRLHTYFARCAECKAQLLLTASSVAVEDEEAEDEAANTLRALDDVHLAHFERSGERDVYRGYGKNGDTPVFLIAEFASDPETPLSPDVALERVASVQAIPFQRLSGFAEVSSIWDRDDSEWDLVF